MEVKEEKPIEEVLDKHNISWSYGDKDKTLKTLDMFKEFIEDDGVNNRHNKIWVVIYYDIAYGDRELLVTCFNDKESAMKYYKYLLGRRDMDVIRIEECEVFPKFKIK